QDRAQDQRRQARAPARRCLRHLRRMHRTPPGLADSGRGRPGAPVIPAAVRAVNRSSWSGRPGRHRGSNPSHYRKPEFLHMTRCAPPPRPLAAGCLLLAVALVPAARGEAPAAPKKVIHVEGITEYRLDNGMRVLLFPDASTSKVTVNLTVLVGSRHE